MSQSSFWTFSRTRKLAKIAGEKADVEKVAEDLELPPPLVRDRMEDLGFIGNDDLADLRDRLTERVVKVRFWKFQSGGFEGGTPSDCDAAWLPSKQYGSSEEDLYLFLESDASTFARVFVECYGFDGEVTQSDSGRTWNVWNTSRDFFKQKLKRNTRRKSRRNQSPSSRQQGSQKVSAEQMSRYRKKYPEVKHLDHPEHWVRLSEQLMIDPMTLKSNLD